MKRSNSRKVIRGSNPLDVAKKLVDATKRAQGKELSQYDCLFNFKHALFIYQFYRHRVPRSSAIDEALIQTYITKTMLDLGMLQGAIRHCEESVRIYNRELSPENDLTKAAEFLLHEVKCNGMVSEMVGKLTSDEDCLLLGKCSIEPYINQIDFPFPCVLTLSSCLFHIVEQITQARYKDYLSIEIFLPVWKIKVVAKKFQGI